MTEKIGKDVIKQKRKLKEKLENANQIQFQMKTLKELGKRKMTPVKSV